MQRQRLTDILRSNSAREQLARAWDDTKAADEFKPLPSGEYIARIIDGGLFTSRTNQTPGYKLTFQVVEGEYTGRRFWDDLWLSAPALPMTKRDLAKLGVNSLDQLEAPIPQGIVCQVKLALRHDDDNTEYNRLRSFVVLRVELPTPDTFAPSDDGHDVPTAGVAPTASATLAVSPDDDAASIVPAELPPGADEFAFGANVVAAPEGGAT